MPIKPKFLIVDDSRTIRVHLKQLIRLAGGDTAGEGANGEEAMKRFVELGPDIVLLDVNMPKMDGRAVLRALIEQHPDAFVVMLSSLDTMEVVQECLELGAKNYLLKSNSDEVIVEELKAAMGQLMGQEARG